MEPEIHTELNPYMRDIVLGLSDGLTVPFAIAAGLAGVAANNGVIIVAAILSEMAAGAISMGLGGYLAANTEARHYDTERKRQVRQIDANPQHEIDIAEKIFQDFGITESESKTVVNNLILNKENWIEFMMRFELGLEKPDQRRSINSGLIIGISYAVGGFFPLIPYAIFHNNVPLALECSIFVTFIALLIFGFIRARFIGDKPWWSMIQTVLLVGIAALAAFALAKVAPHI
jgi:VIT1/CCC1 family predicted Fe2+/Mn2+ transporter